MRGEVEIIRMTNGREHSVLKESNLIMDGLGEAVVTVLTTPSGLVANADPGTSDDSLERLDVSNFTIGSIAFGKGVKGFLNNSHNISNVNLLGFSENLYENFDATATWAVGNWGNLPSTLLTVTSSNEVAGDLSSSVVHLNASAGSTDRYANNLGQFVNTKPLDSLYDSLNFSVDFKFDFEKASQSCNNDNERFSAISISQTSSYAAPHEIISQKFNIIKWDVSGNGSLLNSSEDPNGDFSHGYIKKLGNGWHRLSCVLDPAYRQVLSSTDTLYPYWTAQGTGPATSSLGYNRHPFYDDSDYQTELLSGTYPANDAFGFVYGTGSVDLSSLGFGYGPGSTAQFSIFVKKTDANVRLAFKKISASVDEFNITFSATNGEVVENTYDSSSTNHSYEIVDYSSEWSIFNLYITDTTGDAERYSIQLYPFGKPSAPTRTCVAWGPKLFLKGGPGVISSYNHDITCKIYPNLPIEGKALSGSDRLNLTVDPATLSGGVYISRPSLNYGTAPSIYTPTNTSSRLVPEEPLLGHKVPVGVNYYGMSGVGTLDSDPSSYHVVASPPRIPNPYETLLEYGVKLPIESHKDYEFDIDKNLNRLGFPQSELSIKDVIVSEAMQGFGLRGDARYFGAYCPSTGATVYILSSNDNSGYLNEVSSSYYTAGFNHSSVRSMDKNGHINAYYPTRGETSDASGRLIVSANSDFSSTGEVSCICIIPAGDAAVANMYGGIFEAGLYAMDHQECLSNLINLFGTMSKDVDDNKDLRYKLIAKKTFNDNIVVSKDSGTNAGIGLHDDVKIIWRLKFL